MAISRISRLRPIGFSESNSKSVLGYTSWPKRKTPTAQQLFEQAMIGKMERHSFLDKIKHAGSVAFTPVEWTLDKILRPNYAMAEAFRAATEAPGQQKLLELDPGKFAHGLREGFMGRKKTGFGEVLEQEGVLKGHRKLRGLAGFVYDVGLDPTTYLSGGTSVFLRGGGKGATAVGRKMIQGGVEDVGELKTARKTLEGAGKNYQFRSALAKERERWALKNTVDEGDRAVMAQARSAAQREEIRTEKFLPQIRVGAIKMPTQIGGKQIVPAIPKVSARLRKTPGTSRMVGFLRNAVGNQMDSEMRGLRVTQKHTVENLSQEYLSTIRELTKDLPKLETQRAINALHHFERKGGVDKVEHANGSVDYVLNEERMKALREAEDIPFDEADETFVRMWHDASQYMHKTDESFGIKYAHQGSRGKIYVPHLVDRSGVPYTRAEKNLLKKAGYTKGRGHGDMSLAMIHTAVKEGKLPREIETDPYKLLVTMARTRAHAHADKAALDFLARGVGVPTRVVGPRQAKKIEAHEKQVKEIEEKLLKYDTPSKKNLKQYRGMLSKLDQLNADTKKLKRGQKNKEATRDMVDLDIRDDYGNKILVEREIGNALKRVEKIVDPTEDKTIGDMRQALAGAQGRWKLLATAVNPGYRFRNTVSDFWNMYVAGVPTWAMVRYSGRAANVLRQAKAGDEKAIRILSDAYNQGVLSGLFGGDIGTLARMLQYHGSKKSLAKRGRFLKLSSKVAQDTNRNAENWGRLVHYLYRREHEGMGIADAALEVKKAHFDYEDLTDFERKTIKGLFIPFYTWTRKNVPFQVKSMVSQPGKYAAFPKFARESEYAAGDTEGDIVPDYLSENFAFKVPFGKDTYFTPQIGAADLARFQTPGQAIKNFELMITPFARVPAELATNRNIYTGADIEGTHPRTPISERAAPFLKLIPGMNVGPTSRSTGKGTVTGMGADPQAVYILGQLGGWSRLATQGDSKIRKAQRGYGPGWSQFAGLSVTELDRKQQLLIERMELRDKLKKRLQGIRDEGRYPQPVKRSSAYEKRVNEQIAFGLGR